MEAGGWMIWLGSMLGGTNGLGRAGAEVGAMVAVGSASRAPAGAPAG
jgi:hypothetical protein